MASLEHVNIVVSNPARSAALYCDLFDWKVRWQGQSQFGGTTIHIGEKNSYVAVWAAKDQDPETPMDHQKGRPLNHFGVVVDNLEKTEKRVRDAGLTPHSHGDYQPGRRFYFFDPDGVEVEVISYRKPLRSLLDHLAYK